MQTKQFTGASIDEVLRQIRAELGEEAVILETRRVVKGGLGGFFGREMIEVTAADGLDDDGPSAGGQSPRDAAADLPTANRTAASSMLNVVDEDDPRVPFARQLQGRLAAATEAEDHPAMRPATAAGPVAAPRLPAAEPEPAHVAAEPQPVHSPAVTAAEWTPGPEGPAASPASAYARAAAPAAAPVPTSTPARPFARGDVDRTRAIIEAARAAMRTAEEGRAAAASAAVPAAPAAAAVPPPAFIPARKSEQAPVAPAVTTPVWERISTTAVPGSAAAVAPPPAALVDRRAPAPTAMPPSPVTPAPQPIIPAPAPLATPAPAPEPVAVTPPAVHAPIAEAAATLAPVAAEPEPEPVEAEAPRPAVEDDGDEAGAGGRCAAALRAVRAELVAAGVDPRYLDPFLDGVTRNALPFLADGADVREAVRAAVAARIPVSREWKSRPRHQALAFVGQHGVGKTSVVRKLAWRLHQAGLRVAVVCAGPEADMSLESLASRLGLAFAHVEDGDALAAVRQELSECDIVLIDTPGRSHTNLEDMEELGKLLGAARIEEVHLVLPVSMALADLGDVSRRFRIAGVNRLTITKLDETRLLGNLVNIPLRMAKPLSFLADGVSTTGDLTPADPQRVATLLLP